ncbi:hypothetical protein HMPREF0880_03184 [Yokenella regensburgei ATCC 43003]|nr:hypothetical protein HMPREF0880_03184 [Yokenella regensburgei ATCC 43003]
MIFILFTLTTIFVIFIFINYIISSHFLTLFSHLYEHIRAGSQ